MNWFKHSSIRVKLILIILTVSFVILTLVGGARIAWDMQQARTALAQELSALSRLLGERSSAALAFDDARLGRENLAALHELPHVVQGCLYRNDDLLLAEYRRNSLPATTNITGCPSTAQSPNQKVTFEENHVRVNATISQGTQRLGWISLASDLAPINSRLRDQITFSGLAALIAILFTIVLAAWLQRLISGPIKAVTEVARTIEEQGYHQLRAPVGSHDEVGQMALSFNAMLDTLEAAKSAQEAASVRHRSLVESTSAIPWELDLSNWCFIYVGQQAQKVLGYPIESWHQKNFWADHLYPEDLEQTLSYCQARAARGEDHQFEYRMIAADGRIVWIHDDVQVVFKNNKPVRLQGFMFDISDRKQLEEERRRYRDELEEQVEQRTIELKTANKELESFSYSVSHDLRAPLRAISGFSQMILEDNNDALDASGKGLLTRVIDNTQRMSELIDDLLNLSRLGRKELHTGIVNIDKLVADVVQTLQTDDRHVDFNCAELGSVNADQNLLKIVMENLLGNAWKYTSKTDSVKIEMGKQQQDGETVFFVKDNGAGFDMAYVDKIFGTFQRLHKADEFEGTGIGLATVQRIIHRHGGRIWAEAEIDKGASFYFTLQTKR